MLETEETVGKAYDIGGDDFLSYQETMKIMAKLLRKRRLFLPSPISSIKLYSYIISLRSPVPAQIIACLLESVKNDVINFWRVESLTRNKRLLLRAEMRLPGKAWLEFIIQEKEQHNKLSVVAYFQTKGTAGRL